MISKKRLVFQDVGTAWEEQVFPGFPDRFMIVRVQAVIKSGAGETVACSVRERSDPEDPEDIALEYALVETLDYQENQVVQSYKVRDIDQGRIYCAVKVNTGSNSVVSVLIEYQAV